MTDDLDWPPSQAWDSGGQQGLPIKAWYHPGTEDEIVMSFYDKHFDVARQNWRRMGIPRNHPEPNIQAVENGWVRISTARERDMQGHGYVTARNVRDARDTLRWLGQAGNLPSAMDVETYVDGRPSEFFTVEGGDLSRFVERGTRPLEPSGPSP